MPDRRRLSFWFSPLLLAVLIALAAGVAWRINRHRFAEAQPLVRPGLETLQPQEFVGTVMLGGLRGVVVDYLWVSAADQMQRGRFEQLAATTEALSRMAPHQATAWIFHSWNLAWNVASAFTGNEDSYRWIRRGLDHARRGAGRNPDDAMLAYHVGWLIEQRVLRDDYHIARLADDTVRLHDGTPLVGRLAKLDDGMVELTASVRPVTLPTAAVSDVRRTDNSSWALATLTDGTPIELQPAPGRPLAQATAVYELEAIRLPETAVAETEPGENAYLEAVLWYERASVLAERPGAAIDTAKWIYHGQSRFVLARYVEDLLRQGHAEAAAGQLAAYREKLDALLARYPLETTPRLHRIFLRNLQHDHPRLRLSLGLARVDRAIASAEPAALHEAADELDLMDDLLLELWPALAEQFIRRPANATYHRMIEMKNKTIPHRREAVTKLLNKEPAPTMPNIEP